MVVTLPAGATLASTAFNEFRADAGSATDGDTDGHYGTVEFTGTFSVTGGVGNDWLAGNTGFHNLRGCYGNDDLDGGSTDDLQFVQSTLKVGAATRWWKGRRHAPRQGGFSAGAELVIFTTNAARLTTTAAAATIGSATAAYAAGRTALFAIDNGAGSAVYLFNSSGADALVSAGELTLLATLTGTPSTAVGDDVFTA